MALTREQKQKILEQLKEKIAKQKAIIFVDFTGLKVKDLSGLRRKLKAVGNELKVVKKTLIDLVFKKSEFKIETKKMKGEVALIFGYEDEISPAKATYQFSQENSNLKILGGFFEKKFREAAEIIALAQLPSEKELLAKLVGSVSAPISNFVNVLQGNIKGLIIVLAKAKTKI